MCDKAILICRSLDQPQQDPTMEKFYFPAGRESKAFRHGS